MKNRQTVFTTILIVAGCLLFPKAEAVSPAPDGGYPGGNTAEGQNALLSLTSGGFNTAVGFLSLRSDILGGFNTGVGAGALLANTAYNNTAIGAGALLSNTTGTFNTANGAFALFNNTMGSENTAAGFETLFNNTDGSANTAYGYAALNSNTTGSENTATGDSALAFNTTGSGNTAIGDTALRLNTGGGNTAIGATALGFNTTGNGNIALGAVAGQNLTTGDNNIDIGNQGLAGDSNTIRIGDDANQGATFLAGVYGVAVAGLEVVMDSSDQLGTLGSSRRFKDEIKPMDNASEAVLALKPVTFRYKTAIDPTRTPQFGLVAEDVEKVSPDLVACDKEGKPYGVRYEAVNAMLLNEFLKEHRKVEEQGRKLKEQEQTITHLKQSFQSKLSQQQKQIERLAAGLQKVSAQVEVRKTAPKTVSNNP